MILPISVIMPAYNAEKYIVEAIESVLSQTCPPQEIIVINDGSTDGTLSVLNKYQVRIRVYTRQNRGLPQSINEGISYATQPWLAFLDADDIWHTQKLQSQWEFLSNNPITKIAFTKIQQFISPEQPDDVKAGIYCPSEPQEGLIRPAMLLHRSVFQQVGLFDESLKHGDFIDWFEQVKAVQLPYTIIDKVLYYRRLHRNSMSNNAEHHVDFARLIKAKLDRERKNIKG